MASKRKSNRGGILGGTDKQVEQLLRQYLDERGWHYRWKPAIGSKHPDALVVDAEGHLRAVIEATLLPLLKPNSQKPDRVAFLERAKRAFERGALGYSAIYSKPKSYSLANQARLRRLKTADASRLRPHRNGFSRIIFRHPNWSYSTGSISPASS